MQVIMCKNCDLTLLFQSPLSHMMLHRTLKMMLFKAVVTGIQTEFKAVLLRASLAILSTPQVVAVSGHKNACQQREYRIQFVLAALPMTGMTLLVLVLMAIRVAQVTRQRQMWLHDAVTYTEYRV